MTNRTRRLAVAATLLVALLVPAGAASAKGNGNGNGNGSGRATAPGQVRSGEARGGQPADDEADEADDDADEATEDAQGGRPAVPPGLAKKAEQPGNRPEGTPATGALPPGWTRAAQRVATRPATLTGTVVSVEGATITVTVKGGHPLFRLWALQEEADGGDGTITVELATDAVVKLDDAVVAVSALAEGDHVSIRGTFSDGTVMAGRVNASTPDDTTETESD